MPKMHAITLLATGGLAGTIVGYIIAHYGPHFWPEKLSPYSDSQDKAEVGKSRKNLFNALFLWRKDKPGSHSPSSGNLVFDAYRTEVLQRLEKEQTDFEEYLYKLKMAKDQDEFDSFFTERRKPT